MQGEAEKLARLVSQHHKAVQLTEIQERLRGLQEALGLVPALDEGVSASEPHLPLLPPGDPVPLHVYGHHFDRARDPADTFTVLMHSY